MGKAAAKKVTTTVEPVIDEIDKATRALARQKFMGATLNMGWRLAITVVIPIVGGVKIDERFHSSPSYTLVGLMLASVAGCIVVWQTVKEVNKEQAEDEKLEQAEEQKTKRKEKV